MSYRHRQNPFPKPLHFDNNGMVDGERTIVVTRPFRVVTSILVFDVEEGFVSNGASIPRAAQAIIGHPFDEYLENAVGHDFLYSTKSDRLDEEINDWLAINNRDATDHNRRWVADFLLKETMWNRRLSLWKMASFYAAVRVGGGSRYKRDA